MLGNDPPFTAGERKDAGLAGTERKAGESCVYSVAQLRSDGNWWTGKIVHSGAKPTLGSKRRNEARQGWNMQLNLSHQEICVNPSN